MHNGRRIFYVFGRYPKKSKSRSGAPTGPKQYPVIDLVICDGDFLNADHEYIHQNKSVKGFGSYGDLMVRDRKMYVAPTPFALTEGTTGQITLIVPSEEEPDRRYSAVGELVRIEAEKLVTGYSFDLRSNQLVARTVDNPNAGTQHHFRAYRLAGQEGPAVRMLSPSQVAEALEDVDDEEESE